MLLLSWKMAISTDSYAFNFVYQGTKSLTKSFRAVKDKYWEFKDILWRGWSKNYHPGYQAGGCCTEKPAQHLVWLRGVELPFLIDFFKPSLFWKTKLMCKAFCLFKKEFLHFYILIISCKIGIPSEIIWIKIHWIKKIKIKKYLPKKITKDYGFYWCLGRAPGTDAETCPNSFHSSKFYISNISLIKMPSSRWKL